MSHLSYEGQTKESYCVECAEKHGQTGKVLMREALQRAEACGSGSCEGVVEKIRGVLEELAGFEADTQTAENEGVTALNTIAREIRKQIFAMQAEIGQANMDQLHALSEVISRLVDKTYEVRQKVDCPTCKIEQLEKQPEKHSLDDYGKTVSERRRQLLEEIRARIE
ncbi:hypothetical protein MUP77_13470 [Candidatus Bathyarchaeota archaeon]|nr:hypothetical protein [Candidatus Bathyarchaeota archaeon]